MPSLSFSVNVETLSSKLEKYQLSATLEERKNVAKRLKIITLDKLEANLQLQKKGHIYLHGKIIATITQQCVRTLVPLSEHLEIEVDEVFSISPIIPKKHMELSTEDLIEPLERNILDLGEIVIQLLSLNLNPYPVVSESTPLDYKEKDILSPFEILKKKK